MFRLVRSCACRNEAMNLLGKIFVVLIFVMSLVFMSFAVAVYGTHQNWKTRRPTPERGQLRRSLGQALDNAKQLLEKAEADKAKLEADIAKEAKAKREALAKLETERDELIDAAR